MKKRQNFSSYLLFLIGVFLVFASSCKKDDDNEPSSGNSTNGKTTAVFNPDVNYGTMTDQEGNIYKTITIGTQTWMAENLRTAIYNDGTVIPMVTEKTTWANLTSGAYCNYNNTTNSDTIATYGRLYNWFAVNTGKLAPKGWHVPTDDEWTTLTNILGGSSTAGGKLKEAGTIHWNGSNLGATNESGFTALPGGIRGTNGVFDGIGGYGYWWSVTEYDASSSWVWDWAMYYDGSYVLRDLDYEELGFSVRCVKD
jgi:uncharacterized protein (TIGR02145 family)